MNTDRRDWRAGSYEKAWPDGTELEDMLALSRDAGYDFFEISIDRTDKRIARLSDPAFLRGAARAMERTGHRIGSMCLSGIGTYTLGSPDPSTEEKAKGMLRQAIRAAADLGIRLVQIPGCDVPKNGDHTQQTDARFLENLLELVELAAAESVVLALENMEDGYMDTVTKCMRFVRAVGSPYLQLYSDAGNIWSASLVHGSDARADLMAGAGHYAAFHLKETRPGKYGGLFYGEGHVPFAEMVDIAWGLGIRRYVMEYWYTGNPQWQADLARARTLCAGWIEAAERKANT